MTTTTHTGTALSDKIECVDDHKFETVISDYVSEWKECKACGYRAVVVKPAATVDFNWLNHQYPHA